MRHTVMDCASSRTQRMCASLPSGAMDDTNAALHNEIAAIFMGHFGCKRLGFEGLFGRGPKTPFPHQILQCFSPRYLGF
jgi:hypothetical protein